MFLSRFTYEKNPNNQLVICFVTYTWCCFLCLSHLSTLFPTLKTLWKLVVMFIIVGMFHYFLVCDLWTSLVIKIILKLWLSEDLLTTKMAVDSKDYVNISIFLNLFCIFQDSLACFHEIFACKCSEQSW